MAQKMCTEMLAFSPEPPNFLFRPGREFTEINLDAGGDGGGPTHRHTWPYNNATIIILDTHLRVHVIYAKMFDIFGVGDIIARMRKRDLG